MVKLRPRTRAIASSTSFFISFVKERINYIAMRIIVMIMFVAVYELGSYIFNVILLDLRTMFIVR